MPGPPPKDPRLRQRRNKASTRATLPALADPAAVAGRLSPSLPERGKGEVPWHPETVTFWREVWASPMAAEYIPADVPGLVIVAQLVDRFHYGEVQLAAEIRLQRQCFGLTPLDRRRLQWEIERGETAERRRQQTPSAAPKLKAGQDPRRRLWSVK
jgi:hypothetical protein